MTTLFMDSPAEREKRIDRIVEHIRHAEWLHSTKKHSRAPTPATLLWLLLEDAMTTVRNTPFDELRQVSQVRSLMPQARVSDNEAWALQVARLSSGMRQWEDKQVRRAVNASDVDRMVDVLDLLRFVQGRDRDRLCRATLARAAGLSIDQCGRVWDRFRTDFDRRAMHDIKQRVVGQVLDGMDRHFGLVRTSRGFRRLTVREIEKRKKRREREGKHAG